MSPDVRLTVLAAKSKKITPLRHGTFKVPLIGNNAKDGGSKEPIVLAAKHAGKKLPDDHLRMEKISVGRFDWFATEKSLNDK